MIPSLFITHGTPMLAVEDTTYSRYLEELGRTFPRPQAIILFSAHWESDVQMISEIDEYSMMYDFGGFPNELYQVKYPAKGSKEVSLQVQELLNAAGIANRAERERGLDHGSWTILKRMYPDADIPLIAMSVNPSLTPAEQYAIGKALAPLREQDVLIIGSGVTVHNFGLLRAKDKSAVKSLVLGFEKWLENHMKQWDLDSLFRYEELAPNAKIAVPPQAKEHFIPVFYTMGAANQNEFTKTLFQGLVMDVIMNSVYQYGE
ncbi:dioxygenase [Paenibacillus baekrokdamisoli]|uniref:Dioxygenase n=1 Tax=Paenibacillus baekrokdamisoli TaxID=1712516 RepID=A0A3G9JIZ7_9BACL|nr:class III extradiol ring-cleavage dioxygenase [Paenibacillus baekrokdamisoli]MBB3073389.1 4,5-DOPA dioxygenase extradiol [Paenibacillus baekrokdamisoli]BBH24058.1 dioxygenase [Paenibacillus baekrokdamisoli]